MTKTNTAEIFLSKVNNRETIAVIEVNNDMYGLRKRIEKLPLKCEEWEVYLLICQSQVSILGLNMTRVQRSKKKDT